MPTIDYHAFNWYPYKPVPNGGQISAPQVLGSNWIKLEDEYPPDETEVIGYLKDGRQVFFEIRWEEPTFEDTFTSYRYPWNTQADSDLEFDKIKYWRYKYPDPIT